MDEKEFPACHQDVALARRMFITVVRSLLAALALMFMSNSNALAIYKLSTWERSMNNAALFARTKQSKNAEVSYKNAITEAQQLKSMPKLYLSLHCIGKFYGSVGNYKAAEIYLRRATAVYPDQTATLEELAALYTKTARKNEAERVQLQISSIDNDSPDVDFGPFLVATQRKIKSHWRPPTTDGPKGRKSDVTDAMFLINRKGEVDALCIADSSGVKEIDQSAFVSVADVVPFDRPPAGNSQHICIHFRFDFRHEEKSVSRAKDKDNSRRALSEMEKSLGTQDPSLVFYLCEYAKACSANKDFEEALKLYQRALNIAESNKDTSKSMLMVLSGMAECMVEAGKNDEAENVYKRTIENIDNSSPPPTEAASILHDYGKLLYKTNRTAEGDAMFARERQLLKK